MKAGSEQAYLDRALMFKGEIPAAEYAKLQDTAHVRDYGLALVQLWQGNSSAARAALDALVRRPEGWRYFATIAGEVDLAAIVAKQPDTSSVESTMGAWTLSWNTYDLDLTRRLFLAAPETSYYSSEKPGRIAGFEAALEHHRGFGFVPGGKSADARLWLEDMVVRGGTEMAFVTATWLFDRDVAAAGRPQRGPVTFVLRSTLDGWRIVHAHFANDPPAPPQPQAAPSAPQGTSLLGQPLVSGPPAAAAVENLRRAKIAYEQTPDDPDALIWYGRRLAYTGDYLGAIAAFGDGIRKHPSDARFYRHRGHRYISIRRFDRAIADLERAATLIAGTADTVEPDGAPNAKNIPVSTLHGNVWYHLGLAYYLTNDLPQARRAFEEAVKARTNDDGHVAAMHWLYMILRRMGRAEDAAASLRNIKPEMTIIENTAYHRLCLFYKGLLTQAEVEGRDEQAIMNDAVAYGLANWSLYSGQRAEARRRLEALLARGGWASFGYIAAEADIARMFR
jgi:tetratricopeptide (TPR) repeat protein